MKNEITMLSEDINFLLQWQKNENVTMAQKKRWPHDRKIPKALLGNNTQNCLRLLKEDGLDGEPVGSVAESTARHYFWDNEDKLWPPDRDIVRMGAFFCLGFYPTLAMVLKGQWEKYFSREMDWKNKDYKDLSDILKNSPRDAISKSGNFNVGMNRTATVEDLFRIFEEHGNLPVNEGYDLDQFRCLINQMILEYMHLCAVNSPEMENFIGRQKKERENLHSASTEDQDKFWIKKCSWLEAEQEIGRRLLACEDQRLKNFNIVLKWNSQFGEAYLRLIEVECCYHSLNRQALIKEADPSLGKEKVERLDAEKKKEEEDELDKLKKDIAYAILTKISGPNGTEIKETAVTDYQKECRKVLSKIFMYTHYDRYEQKANNFTENQKRKLREYFNKAIKIRDEEQGLDIRSLVVLQDILESVKSLWDLMGVDINAEAVIQGHTLDEQLEWVEKQILKLEEYVKEIDSEIYALRTDKDIQEKLGTMASEETIAKTAKSLEEKSDWYEKQIAELKTRLQILFKTEEEK